MEQGHSFPHIDSFKKEMRNLFRCFYTGLRELLLCQDQVCSWVTSDSDFLIGEVCQLRAREETCCHKFCKQLIFAHLSCCSSPLKHSYHQPILKSILQAKSVEGGMSIVQNPTIQSLQKMYKRCHILAFAEMSRVNWELMQYSSFIRKFTDTAHLRDQIQVWRKMLGKFWETGGEEVERRTNFICSCCSLHPHKTPVSGSMSDSFRFRR